MSGANPSQRDVSLLIITKIVRKNVAIDSIHIYDKYFEY